MSQDNDKEVAGKASELVVIGSSAGGIEAVSTILSSLGPDFPAAIVIAQHLERTRPSELSSIFKRRTPLKLVVVEETCRLEAGSVYVVPANHNVIISDGQVEISDEDPNNDGSKSMPSIDLLFRSAAQAYGERLIAIILTGFGSDGAAGVLDVKKAGGTVIVQNPFSARFPYMPQSVPPTSIDFKTDLNQIGPLLNSIMQKTSLLQRENYSEDTLRPILDLVSQQTSMNFRQYKVNTILRRISRRMAGLGLVTLEDYHSYLKLHPEEVGVLIEALLINVTYFFRDQEAYNLLKNEILPDLLAQARENDRMLRFWSAGCATGEEPYSLAMLLIDLLGEELQMWNIKIFATDVDEAAINFARRGYYTETHLKGLSDDYRSRFFEQVDHTSNYRVSKTLRQMVLFGQQDLTHSSPFPRINLVLCRNVLIYFMPDLQDSVLNQFAFSLWPGGYLLLGKAETIRPNHTNFELVNKHWKAYRCTGVRASLVHRPAGGNFALVHTDNPRHDKANKLTGPNQLLPYNESQMLTNEVNHLRRFNEMLLRYVPVGVLVIDRNYRLWTANAAARRLLGLHNSGKDQDFLHSVRGIPYTEVRRTIDSVFRERNAITLSEVELDASMGGSGKVVSFSVFLLQMDSEFSDLVAISVVDVTEQVLTRRELVAAQTEQGQLMQELSGANRRLSDLNKELLDSNEELQVSNEELVLTHEELQATIEEFETTNEELQATNEELETNNEELQATNEELQTTNEELRARTSELQELTGILDNERNHLNGIIEQLPINLMVLRGPQLVADVCNSRFARIVEGQKVSGRRLEDIVRYLGGQLTPLVDLCHQVYQQNEPAVSSPLKILTKGGLDGQMEKTYIFSVSPIHDAEGQVDGVIINATERSA